MTTIAKSIHAPLVVAAGYFAHPARAVSSDLGDLLGPRPLAQQPHDLKVRAFYGVLRFPVEVLQLFCSRMRRQLYPLWHTCILQPDSVSRLARPENPHDGASGAPLEQHTLTDTDLQHIVPACGMRQAENSEREVSFTWNLGVHTVDRFYVVAQHAISIGHSMA